MTSQRCLVSNGGRCRRRILVSACRHAGWAIWYCDLCVCVDVGGTTENKLVYVCVCVCVVVRMWSVCVCAYICLCVCLCMCIRVYISIHVYVPVCCVYTCKNVYTCIHVCACLCVLWVKVEFLYSVLISWPANLTFFFSLSRVSTGFLANFALTLSLEWQQQHPNVNKNTSFADNLWSWGLHDWISQSSNLYKLTMRTRSSLF